MKKIDYTFVCIGTNRIISDSFGPRVGKKLKQVFYKNENINVYGTMENPIHLKNVEYFLKKITHLAIFYFRRKINKTMCFILLAYFCEILLLKIN